MKSYFLIGVFAGAMLFVSCKKHNSTPEIEKSVDKPNAYVPVNFAYTGKMEISEFVVYKGAPDGGKDVAKDHKPEDFFAGRIAAFLPPVRLFFSTKDTLSQLPKRVSVDVLKYKFDGDTLKGYNPYSEAWEVYGIKKDKRLEYRMNFYVFNRVNGPSTNGAAGTAHGMVLFNNVFRKGGVNFESPAQMTNANDLMGWYNVSFIYEKTD